jgi:hypothetical protein
MFVTLIMDGHGSHINMKFINFCDKNKILLCIFPPHATHRLQPLDVSLFSPLATYYSQELDHFQMMHEGMIRFTKRNFFTSFWKAWTKTFTEKNVLSGWRKTGLFPFDPEVVLATVRSTKDKKEQLEDIPLEDTLGPSSPFQTVKEAWQLGVGPNPTREQREAFKTVKEVFTTCKLLERRVHGLQASIKLEQQRATTRKAVFKDLLPPEHGKAVFWSPGKVAHVRELDAQKEEDARQEEVQKEAKRIETACRKEEKDRLDKAKVEKRLQDQIDREFREEKKRKEIAERARARKMAAEHKKEAEAIQKQLRGEAKAYKMYAAPKKGSKKGQVVNAIMEEVEELVGPSTPIKRVRRKPEWLKDYEC